MLTNPSNELSQGQKYKPKQEYAGIRYITVIRVLTQAATLLPFILPGIPKIRFITARRVGLIPRATTTNELP